MSWISPQDWWECTQDPSNLKLFDKCHASEPLGSSKDVLWLWLSHDQKMCFHYNNSVSLSSFCQWEHCWIQFSQLIQTLTKWIKINVRIFEEFIPLCGQSSHELISFVATATIHLVDSIFDQDWSKSWIDPNRKWLIDKVLWNSIQSRGLNNIFSLRNSLKKRAVGADLQQPPKFKFKIKKLSRCGSFSIRNSLRNHRLEWNLQQPPFFEFEIQKSRAPPFRQIPFLT